MIIYVLENLNDFIINVDTMTSVMFSKENIVFSCGLLDTSGKENITVINSVSKTMGLNKQAQKPPIFCKTVDSFGKEFLIHSDGEVELLQSPTSDDSLELTSRNSQHLTRGYHFSDKIPSSQFERFFVVNQDFSGHEFVHKDDVNLFLFENKNRLKNKNVKITKNPTCGKLESKTIQYPLFENYFQSYSIPYTNLESNYFPKNFLRSALSKRWNLIDSQWLFKGDAPIEKSVQSKVFQFQTKRENKPVAIVYRTLNEICRNNDNKVKNVAKVLLSYEARNNELFSRYSRKRFKRRQLLDKFYGEVIEKPE
ncbi:hypothetical protein LSTR_LSTR011870 [Laodelphax striatellus]|uniref:Uncharacterized protein n=1 Tax=Laodelphax striatellus TaxID=195883 RepID=A0A482XKC5_LAOST|nr:hypothetical protein LSTR_LSTR011870 [Laodelphax striatellus]